METSEWIFIIVGSAAAFFILIGVIVGVIYRLRYKVLDREERNKVSPDYYSKGDLEAGHIRLNDVNSTLHLNPPTKPNATASINRSTVQDSYFTPGEGYYNSHIERKGFLKSPEISITPSNHGSYNKQELPPSYDSKKSDLNPYGKEVVVLEGLLESKKWKLKDYKIDSGRCIPTPPPLNQQRNSYHVW